MTPLPYRDQFQGKNFGAPMLDVYNGSICSDLTICKMDIPPIPFRTILTRLSNNEEAIDVDVAEDSDDNVATISSV